MQELETLRRGALQYGLDRSETIHAFMGRGVKHGVEEVTSVAFEFLRCLLPLMDGREVVWIERKLQSDPNLPVPVMPKNYTWDKQDQQVCSHPM